MYRSILGFDTSGINALHGHETDAEYLLGGLNAAYAIRLNATILDEIVAHREPQERERLRVLCRKLLVNGEGDILLPFHEITTRLALAFEANVRFDWTRVDVRSSEYLGFIYGEELADIAGLSAEQLKSANESAEQFEQVFLDPRPIFQKLQEARRESWPKSAAELTEMLKRGRPQGAYWNIAKGLFTRATGRPITDERIEVFVRECPPFRALLAALMVAQFDRAVAVNQPRRFAGRNDLFMAVYLPYCDEFISNDRPQQIVLREVAAIAEMDVRVRWYREFTGQFVVSAAE